MVELITTVDSYRTELLAEVLDATTTMEQFLTLITDQRPHEQIRRDQAYQRDRAATGAKLQAIGSIWTNHLAPAECSELQTHISAAGRDLRAFSMAVASGSPARAAERRRSLALSLQRSGPEIIRLIEADGGWEPVGRALVALTRLVGIAKS